MDPNANNRFQDFFEQNNYITLKNYLYNYRLRKMAVENSFKREMPELVLEVGSGISPVMTKTNRIIYTDLSLTALQILRYTHAKGWYVVADGLHLPFKTGVFTHAICSEVLEHIPDDKAVIKELSRIMRPTGRLIITFPHRRFYFTIDDRFVEHYRRYELSEMVNKLMKCGLRPISIQKILGPLEKVTMCLVIGCISLFRLFERQSEPAEKINKTPVGKQYKLVTFIFKWANRCYAALAWLDAMIMPRALATVLLIDSELLDKPVPEYSIQNSEKQSHGG